MKKSKYKKKQADATGQEDNKAVISLDSEKLKTHDRIREAKLKIIKKIAATDDLSKLNELNQFDESELIIPTFTDEELNASFRSGLDKGLDIGDQEKKVFHNIRTKLSSKTKIEQRKIKARYIIDTYIKIVNDKTDKARIENLSESKMAAFVKARVEDDLINAKTHKHKPVLPRKVDRKGKVTFSGLSIKTIISILRKRDKEKLPFYPWENR